MDFILQRMGGKIRAWQIRIRVNRAERVKIPIYSGSRRKETVLLREFVAAGHYKFAKEAKTWEEAVRMSCEALEADGSIGKDYKEDIIASVKKYGPYLVIMPQVAMPHAQKCGESVKRTAISFMKLERPVSFEPGNPGKDAVLFFTLASCNPKAHLENITRLSGILSDEETLLGLFHVRTPEDLLKLQDSYEARRENG